MYSAIIVIVQLNLHMYAEQHGCVRRAPYGGGGMGARLRGDHRQAVCESVLLLVYCLDFDLVSKKLNKTMIQYNYT